MYYRDAVAAIICYDLTNEASFQSVNYWTNEMQQKNNLEKFIIALAGNKCDIDEKDWMINKDEVEGLSRTLGDNPINVKTSARTGEGVKDLFLTIAE
jgi:GTPase SAR1 family protein